MILAGHLKKKNPAFFLESFNYFALIVLLLISTISYAGTTGKINGRVIDAETGEAVFGASVVLEGTYLGASADLDGYYSINNVPPGEYRIIVSAVGFQKTIYSQVLVKIDLTTKLDLKIKTTTVALDVKDVVITAERPMVQKDLTSTSVTVTSAEIKMMPVESVGQIINLQAGVVGGHFRGGRSNEVAYLVDGVSVTDGFNGSLSMQVENSSIRQMEVISGTFNAEYGQAMSGVVNIVTQEGSSKLEGSVSGYIGNFITANTSIFRNLDKITRIPTRDLTLSLSGPLGIDKLSFFLTGRYYQNDGYLFGKRVYNITDDVPFFPNPSNQTIFVPRNTGDGAFVAMNPDRKYSFNGKIAYSLPSIKFAYSFFFDDNYNKYYDHGFSWTPDGTMNHYRRNYIHGLQITHYPSQNTYQTLKFSANLFDYKGYLYEDPYDPRYVSPRRGLAVSGYTFRSGGNDGGRYERNTKTYVGQWALSSQISKEHKLGIGLEGKLHTIYNHNYSVINLTDGQLDTTGAEKFTLGYRNLGTQGNQAYTKYPIEASAYIQDKIEYDILIINAGIRLDYFNPNAQLPADLKNPTKNTSFPGANQFVDAKYELQVSPRLGCSFPITENGIIRFSYGHFFQTPNFEHLYANSDYLVVPGASLATTMGNPDLKAQKTIMYEIGLQQVLFKNIVLNVTGYYRDIRNLLGMEIINTYEGFKYARFINRDYGNVRGFILTLEKRYSDFFSAKLDYTYQIAEGNSSDPYAVYNKNQTVPPIEESKTVVPLDWDQRSTLNLSINIGNSTDWTLGIIFQYGSGWPYTEDQRVSNGVRFENGGIKPQTFNLDLRFEKVFNLAGLRINTFALIYNVLDIKNENGVYATTGRANTDLNTKYAGQIIGLNSMEEYVNNPAMYSTPREIRIGFGFGF